MYSSQSSEYDVVILGARAESLCQARHLLLNIPNLRIALVNLLCEEWTEQNPPLNESMGESMIEITSLFVCKDLGLYDYMIENHPPKSEPNFHWPKTPAKTQTIDDYYHIWANRQPAIPSFQMNRAKFERDLLAMNQEMGADFYNGRLVDVDLAVGDALKTIKIEVGKEYIELKAKHLIDAAGRQFIIGGKTDNLLFGSGNLNGINTGLACVRVKNVDRTVFHNGYDPTGATWSHYYATNHWFGKGHWLWMTPTDKDSKEVSIGIVHDYDLISAEHINTIDKFYAFLKANHTILYQLVTSGENVEFHYLPRLAYTSKTMFSPDNWYVIGDAAYFFDGFYSFEATIVPFMIESVTEIVRAKLAGEADAEQKRSAYNELNVKLTQNTNYIFCKHPKQVGHASMMSWSIYFKCMWWSGVIVPMYVGKWFLDLTFIPRYLKVCGANLNFIPEVYEQLNQLAQRNTNIGLMDCYRADQLIGGYHPFKTFDNYLENTKLEPRRCNMFGILKNMYFYMAIWYTLLQWKSDSILGVFAPRPIYNFFNLLALSLQSALGEMLLYRPKNRGLPANTQVAKMRQEFKSYRYRTGLQPWNESRANLSKQEQKIVEQYSSDQDASRVQELPIPS